MPPAFRADMSRLKRDGGIGMSAPLLPDILLFEILRMLASNTRSRSIRICRCMSEALSISAVSRIEAMYRRYKI